MGASLLNAQYLDAGRGEEYLAECVEQLTGLLVRSQTPTAELIELVEAREFNFEL